MVIERDPVIGASVDIAPATMVTARDGGDERLRAGEVPLVTCPFWLAVSASHKVPLVELAVALGRGYHGCGYCLPHVDSGSPAQ
jgi:hypothetical protein